jgi:hypothetical protein
MLALADPAIAEVGTHVQGVIAIETRELKLAVIGDMPDVIQDQGAVRASRWRESMVSPGTKASIGIKPGW